MKSRPLNRRQNRVLTNLMKKLLNLNTVDEYVFIAAIILGISIMMVLIYTVLVLFNLVAWSRGI